MTGHNVQFTKRIKSGVCTQRVLTWSDMCDMVNNPIKIRTEAELWSFYILRGLIGEYGLQQGNKDNAIYVVAMQIDYDDGSITIDKFMNKFSEYKFILYTSKSHTPQSHRFRVVMPLKKPILNEIFASKSSREYLKSLFVGCDKTTFDGWRKQRIPHILQGTTTCYDKRINEGKLFYPDVDLMQECFIADKAKFTTGGGYVCTSIDPLKSTLEEIDNYNRYNSLISLYSSELSSINFNLRGSGEDVHARTRKIIYSLRMFGLSSDDTYAFVMGYAPRKVQKEMYELCYGDIR